jgi:hypothetical protein
MYDYRYKRDSDIDAYGDTENVIHFKFGDCRKMYHFTDDFMKTHPRFCEEYIKYWEGKESLFTDALSIVNYIDTFDVPVRLYSNFVDAEFEDVAAAREWVAQEYTGNRRELYKLNDKFEYVGLDGEIEVKE